MTKSPIVFNEYPDRLVQLTMTGSVGRAGQNPRPDVLLVQRLLNLTERRLGGPAVPLRVDGLAGPKTIQAIVNYQTINRLLADGRIDAYGPTMMHLMRCLNAAQKLPAPGSMEGLARPRPEIARALVGSNFMAAGRTVAAAAPRPDRTGWNTGWDLATTSSFDVSVGLLGVAVINMYAKHDTEKTLKEPYCFSFAGAGVGLSLLPVGLDFSFADMPSWGTKIVRLNQLAKQPVINAQDFVGLPTLVLSLGANVGPGWSGTAVHMGLFGCAFTGMQAGMPGGSISLYVGAIAGWT